MLKTQQSALESALISARESILDKVQKLFREKALEGHLFGSLARGNSDAYSDIDIWFTFPNEKVEEILAGRFEFYAKIGEVLHICEPPQNAPLQGVQSSVTYKTTGGYLTVDYSLSPLSTACRSPESQTLFGPELPIKTMGFNPQKVQVPESYRIDFLMIFIFSAIKKLLRKQAEPLKDLFEQYSYLPERHNIPLAPLPSVGNQDFSSLKQIIENIEKVASPKQRKMLGAVDDFIKRVEV